MRRIAALLLLIGLPLAAQETKIAVVGLAHGHVWGHIQEMMKGQTPAKLVGVSEANPDLLAEYKKLPGSEKFPTFADYNKMLDQTKPDIVWSFVPNNEHLAIVQACAPRKINVIFEKPLAATYKDALTIRELAKKHGIRIMTNYQMAWWEANYTAKQQADSGAIGQVWRLHGIVGHGGPGSSGRNKYFFDWLTDPVKNGAGALMDFGCYNALWSLWYMGRPESVFAQVNHLRPETFPKVEDNSDLTLSYKNGVGVFEGSWDLPRSFQDLEVFGLKGSVYMTKEKVEVRGAKKTAQDIALTPLPAERAEPVAYMVNCLRTGKPIEGLVAIDINVGVNEIIEAAKMSAATGKAVKLPLQ
jgi:predicted dehydrogenase